MRSRPAPSLSFRRKAAIMGQRIDIGAENPRMQCDCCGKWMRIHCKPYTSKGGYVAEQKFFGGCAHAPGNGDHLAGHDVCDDCCHVECKRLAEKG